MSNKSRKGDKGKKSRKGRKGKKGDKAWKSAEEPWWKGGKQGDTQKNRDFFGKTPIFGTLFPYCIHMRDQLPIPNPITSDDISNRIYTIRGMQVMLDEDLAKLYQIDTGALNRQVKRNIERFPDDFCFQISKAEYDVLKCQVGRANTEVGRGGRRTLPWAFTEQGISMLSSVIHTKTSILANISIMRSFVKMRHYLANNAFVFQRLDRIELKQLETDENIRQIFKQLETPKPDKAVIFFKGQMWDATSCIEEIIGKAEESIILIDGYVDKGTLDMLSRKKPAVNVEIHTLQKTFKLTEKEISTFRSQYGKLEIKFTDEFHDRFLILDRKALYHIGASIKDAGKKAFEISPNEDGKLLESLIARL